MELVKILQLLIIVLVFIIMVLACVYAYIVIKNKKKEQPEETQIPLKGDKKATSAIQGKESINDFMDFDEIKDNMIIRKNRNQYVMVVRCKGVNYDLMSEEEKVAVEAGFVQFLNTLRFPVQLYIQTTSLNLRSIIEDYKKRLEDMQRDIQKTEQNMQIARANGNIKQYNNLSFEKRRKENVLEYTADISDYIARMSANQNVLQQKNYVVVSYYAAEAGSLENLSKEEVDSMCFSELYTRTQTTLRALGSAGVIGSILNSEELAELLYAAYNRDESEVMQLSRALDAEYDALYSTGKDVIKKREEIIDDMLDREAVDLATQSITKADEKIKNERKIMEKALEIIEEYKEQMSDELYKQTKEEIKSSTQETEKSQNKEGQSRTIRRGRPKKTDL